MQAFRMTRTHALVELMLVIAYYKALVVQADHLEMNIQALRNRPRALLQSEFNRVERERRQTLRRLVQLARLTDIPVEDLPF